MQGYYRLSTFWSDDTAVTHTPGATASDTILKNNTLTLGYERLNSRTTSDIPERLDDNRSPGNGYRLPGPDQGPLLSGLIAGVHGEGGGQTGGKDKNISARANITYQIFPGLSARLDNTYTNLTSSSPLEGYVENLARAALTASFY
jgi:hypothetical protein